MNKVEVFDLDAIVKGKLLNEGCLCCGQNDWKPAWSESSCISTATP
jgi:hypothetical protein